MRTSIILASAFAAGIAAWWVIKKRTKKSQLPIQSGYQNQHHLTNVFAKAKAVANT